MANYYEACRTNYFRVKDPEAFKAAMARISGVAIVKEGEPQECRFAILGEEEGGGWPSDIVSASNPEETEELDFMNFVSEHLADGEVAIFMGTGAEKLRYLTGYAQAFNNKGEYREVNISDIYKVAAELAPEGAEITRAEY